MSPERIYRLLLRAYPPAFRAEYEREMMLVFRDQCRDSDVRNFGFWVHVFWDVVRSAPALRAEATRTVEVVMKLAAVLTVLLGAFGILGAVRDWLAASEHAGIYVVAVVLGVLASALLVSAGVEILLELRQAARAALLASLVCFVVARLMFPWMGIFLQLVGFVLPLGLFIALYWPRKSSTFGAASVVLAALAVPQLCRAQSLPVGRWTGSAGSMDQPEALAFDVTMDRDSLRIILHSKTGDDYHLDNIRLNRDTLSFTLRLARPLPQGDSPGAAHGARCTLLRKRDTSYDGICTGPNGMPSRIRMVPPRPTQSANATRDLPLTAAQRQSYVGTYSVMLPMGGQDVLRVFDENGILKAHGAHENRTGRLFYQGDRTFRPEGSNFVIKFVFDGARASGFTGQREDGVVKGTRSQ